jgi:hypothetical protein
VKALLRAPAVQGLLALILTNYLRLCFATMRWRREGEDAAEAARGLGRGVIVCFWHGRIALSPASWPLGRNQRGPQPRALISLSPDGEFIARTMAALGVEAIRGSSVKASDRAKPKGGGAAFREALAWVGGGGGLAITPDGPRGPAERMAEGAARLAQRTRAPTLLVGLACSPAIRLKSWDRAVLPVPFGRGAVVWTGPLEADERPAAELCAAWGEALSGVTARAEALVA